LIDFTYKKWSTAMDSSSTQSSKAGSKLTDYELMERTKKVIGEAPWQLPFIGWAIQ
jgi:hypothetical protein